MTTTKPTFIESERVVGLAELMFAARQFAQSRRQFAVTFDADGAATISAPMIGNRNPATPQPTPPQTQALRRAA